MFARKCDDYTACLSVCVRSNDILRKCFVFVYSKHFKRLIAKRGKNAYLIDLVLCYTHFSTIRLYTQIQVKKCASNSPHCSIRLNVYNFRVYVCVWSIIIAFQLKTYNRKNAHAKDSIVVHLVSVYRRYIN